MMNNVTMTRRTFVRMLGAAIASTSLVRIPEFLTDDGGDGQLTPAVYTPQDPLAWIVIDGVKMSVLRADICMHVDMLPLPPEPWMPVKRIAGPMETKLMFTIADDGGHTDSVRSQFVNGRASYFRMHVPEFPGVYYGEIMLSFAQSRIVNGYSVVEVDSQIVGGLSYDRGMTL